MNNFLSRSILLNSILRIIFFSHRIYRFTRCFFLNKTQSLVFYILLFISTSKNIYSCFYFCFFDYHSKFQNDEQFRVVYLSNILFYRRQSRITFQYYRFFTRKNFRIISKILSKLLFLYFFIKSYRYSIFFQSYKRYQILKNDRYRIKYHFVFHSLEHVIQTTIFYFFEKFASILHTQRLINSNYLMLFIEIENQNFFHIYSKVFSRNKKIVYSIQDKNKILTNYRII